MKIGLITEGTIDDILLRPLLRRIAKEKASIDWPVQIDDGIGEIPIRRRGFGGVQKNLENLVKLLATKDSDYDIYVAILDRRTDQVQDKIAKDIRGKDVVLGIAIEEIEAWWLGDRSNTLAWTGLKDDRLEDDYKRPPYNAEKDPFPKRTLNSLIERSGKFGRSYGDGDTVLAKDFVEKQWDVEVHLKEIIAECPKGFGDFQQKMADAFKRTKAKQKR
ncbi:MAG: hypothetical protein HZA50_00030 [Planctomycetes bacterium]|nr:hypothetical protein [Planctomycetota bacterium]